MQGSDPDALKVVRRLLSAGHEAYLVGGCVRDLYLGRTPKDFDIATSATPEAIRKLFRNSRIIGRRFKLAHVFFGPKIIETSTFRTAPQSSDDDDPLIRHDNEWGSVEDDARRRDFTINGLFFDVETERIVDFVDGLDDLDRRTIRTIGDPETRFREDPVRMIRAVKFAARLDFSFDPDTWTALIDCAPDIVKCSRARVLEEIYKLLRGGAARRSLELLIEAGLLTHMMPEYLELYDEDIEAAAASLLAAATEQGIRGPLMTGGSNPDAAIEPGSADSDDRDDADDDDGPRYSAPALLWRYLAALDDYTLATKQEAANGVLQAVLFAPLLASEMATASRQALDRRIEELMSPIGSALGVARRDRELARQILMAHRRMVDTSGRRRRGRTSLAQRQYFHDALIFLGIAVKATGDGGSELSTWRDMARSIAPPSRRGGESKPEGGRRRRRRGGKKRRKNQGSSDGGSVSATAASEG